MLSIRLKPTGRKHQISYRVVVVERRSKLVGPPVEDLGFYDPTTKTSGISKERAVYWIGVGAKPSVTVHNLFVQEGITSGTKLTVPLRKKKKGEEGGEPAPAPESGKSDEEKASGDADPEPEKADDVPAEGTEEEKKEETE